MRTYPKLIDYEIKSAILSQSEGQDLDGLDLELPSNSNKNFLYFVGLIASIILMFFILVVGNLPESAVESLAKIIDAVPFFDLKLSTKLIEELQFPNPVTSALFIGNLGFLGYVVFDTLRKQEMRAKSVYGDLFKESSSVSYTIHILILLFILLSIFVNANFKPKVQVTKIEFIPTQTESKKPPPKTNRRAEKQSQDAGKHNPKKKVTPVTKPPGKPKQSKPVAKPKPKPKPPPKPRPKPKAPVLKPIQQPKPVAPPKPAPPKLNKPSPKPRPLVAKPKAMRDAIKPVADLNPHSTALPKLMNYSPNSNVSQGVSSPAPVPKSSRSSSASADASNARGSELVARLSNIPKAPDFPGSGGRGGAYGTDSNPPPNSNPNAPPSLAAQADINFGPYMSKLQRKIKRSWKPPRGTESNRIVVTFTIARNGTLSDLKILEKSIFPEANLAAMEAVTKASPFDPLPRGSAPTVDIEFTFDYNVFQKTRW